MSVSLFIAVIAAWIVVGVGVAIAFGTLGRSSNNVEDESDELSPTTVEHLRPHKRGSAKLGAMGACAIPGEKLQRRAAGH